MTEARDEAADRLTRVLRHDREPDLATRFDRRRRNAELSMIEHGEREAAEALTKTCPCSLNQIVGHGCYPAYRHGVAGEVPGDT